LSILFLAQMEAKDTSQKYPQDLINVYVGAIDQIGDLCSEKPKIFQESENIEKALELAFWTWERAPYERHNIAISINCLSEANPVIFKKLLNSVSDKYIEDMKNEIEKAKKAKKEGNA